jgi:ribosomal protein S27E
MTTTKCPGQDTQFWQPGDIFEITCPNCNEQVEFYKDDAKRRCPGCGHRFVNPKLNRGCAEWCEFADKCLGLNADLHEEQGEETL